MRDIWRYAVDQKVFTMRTRRRAGGASVLVDASGSMKENLGFLQEAAINFVYKLEDVDIAQVVQFNESIKGSARFTDDVDPDCATHQTFTCTTCGGKADGATIRHGQLGDTHAPTRAVAS